MKREEEQLEDRIGMHHACKYNELIEESNLELVNAKTMGLAIPGEGQGRGERRTKNVRHQLPGVCGFDI